MSDWINRITLEGAVGATAVVVVVAYVGLLIISGLVHGIAWLFTRKRK